MEGRQGEGEACPSLTPFVILSFKGEYIINSYILSCKNL